MSNAQSMRNPGWIWGAALLGVSLFMVRYGYSFGFSDQDEFLPLAAHILDKDLFLSDWFVSMQFEGFSIRWPMAMLVALPSTFLPVWSVIFLLHMATGLASGLAVGRLAHRIFHSRTATLIAVVAILALTTRWNPGGNDILHAMLVPSSVAWAFVLSAVERMHARRFLMAGLLLGAATLFHPLLGLQAGGLMVLISLSLSDLSGKQHLRLAIPYLAILIPMIVLLSSVGAATPEATYILTHLRAPHHYLPQTFSGSSWLVWAGLILISGTFLMKDFNGFPRRDRVERDDPHDSATLPAVTTWDRAFLARLIGIPVMVLMASLLLTAWPIEWPLAVRIQPWAFSPLVRVVAVLSIAGYATTGLQSRLKAAPFLQQRRMSDALLAVVGGLVLAFVLTGLGSDVQGNDNPDRELHEWALEFTDKDAVFVIPPSMSGFQFGASRAQYVSFKSFPFAPEPTLIWWERLQETAPVPEQGDGGVLLQERLDRSYATQSLSDIRTFVATRDVDYIVRPADDPARWQDREQPEWCGDRWCVYWAGRILTQPARPTSP